LMKSGEWRHRRRLGSNARSVHDDRLYGRRFGCITLCPQSNDQKNDGKNPLIFSTRLRS
jgi:hypothetical protein